MTDLGAQVADAVWGFRRVARRAVRQSFPGPPLPPSEAELLAYVGRYKGVGVNDAAQALQLAPNTVSTLVGQLGRAGYLERRPDPNDRRAARLHLTVAGAARIRHWRRHRAEVLAKALESLEPAERGALAAALPALRHLAMKLEQSSNEEA